MQAPGQKQVPQLVAHRFIIKHEMLILIELTFAKLKKPATITWASSSCQATCCQFNPGQSHDFGANMCPALSFCHLIRSQPIVRVSV